MRNVDVSRRRIFTEKGSDVAERSISKPQIIYMAIYKFTEIITIHLIPRCFELNSTNDYMHSIYELAENNVNASEFKNARKAFVIRVI